MNTLPLFFNLTDKPILIVGGGDVAYRKAMLLNKAGAKITVIAKNVSDDFYTFLTTHHHKVVQKSYEPHDLTADKFVLMICATNDNDLNERIYHQAHTLNIPVNVVDTPHLCDFIFPAIVDRNPVMIGISTNGNAPVLARLLRAKIERILPQNIGTIAKQAGNFRVIVKQKLAHISKRRHFWESVFNKVISDKSLKSLDDELGDFIAKKPSVGEVYIVGAGTGDPDLLTLKALRLMGQADVVLYDALVPDVILDLCRRDSQKIFVGKKRSYHTKSQDEINALLIKYAKDGKRVLRLKGGDPFVFGRGGEELLACKQAGIAVQVVSGITSALSASASSGIPLTHRGVATSVRFLTACYQTGEHFDGLKSTYHADETLVFYMGLHALDKLVTNLMASSVTTDTPIAIISHASLPTQQILKGTLGDIVDRQAKVCLPAPAVIIVGNVVKLHQSSDKWLSSL
ncbi:siroheme synthase CysG [Moraxella nasovis]|uniref:siroheme synthase CysG n=1 Tax=Moraxella nasovis TaxID=2904121 RepID=UPI001F61F492|nr:siroheme synthase CysG [Moraxella nasovis]UNU74210.1 siroheme synthase CysG [Moraxella nasovis]